MFYIKFSFSLGYFSSTNSTAVATSRKHGRPRSSAPKKPSPKASSVRPSVSDTLVDVREASLSANARKMQRLARLNYHPCRIPITERTSSKGLRANTRICPKEAARIDKQSLKALEVATRSNSQPPKQSKSARPQLPTSARWTSPTSCRQQPEKAYQGTPPYETPSSPTGSEFNINSIPSKIPSDLTDSELFKSDCERLFATEQEHEKADGSASLRPTSSPRLTADDARASYTARVQQWLDGSKIEMLESRLKAISSREISMSKAEPVASEEERQALENVDGVSRTSARIEERSEERKSPRNGGGHSVDSWNAEEQDYIPTGSDMLDVQSQEVGSVPEDSTNEVDVGQHDEEAWLDLGLADDAE